jgi:RNA polymerase sigma-70 factor (ECF subfamily)
LNHRVNVNRIGFFEFFSLNLIFSQPSCVNHTSIILAVVHKSLHEIIEGCKKDDLRSQEKLYRLCYPPMIKVCLRYAFGDYDTAGMYYNSAMLKILTNIIEFRNEGEFMGWVRRIMVNACIDHCRLKSKFQPVEMNQVKEYIHPVLPEIYNKFSGNEIMALVHELPRNTGLVFNLFVIDGYKHEEIARLLGITSGTSKWHLNEARRLLKEKLDLNYKKDLLKHVI